MSESTITTKGQTTVPADVRHSLGSAPGTKLVWSPLPDGRVLVRVKNKSVLEMVGLLTPPAGKQVAVEDMNPWY